MQATDQADSEDNFSTKEEKYNLSSNSGTAEFLEVEQNRMDSRSLGEDTWTDYGDDSQSTLDIGERSGYLQIPFGFQSRGSYKHASKNCEIVGGNPY